LPSDIKELSIPSSFNCGTDQFINAKSNAKSLSDADLSGVNIKFYTNRPYSIGVLLNSGFTNSIAVLSTEVFVPTYLVSGRKQTIF